MPTKSASGTWDLDESPTLREVGAYLEGVVDTMTRLEAAHPVSELLALAPLDDRSAPVRGGSRLVDLEKRPDNDARTTSGFVVAMARFEASLAPLEPSRAEVASDASFETRGGSRLLDLDGPAREAAQASTSSRRDTLPYFAQAVSVLPADPAGIASVWPDGEGERSSGYRLRLAPLGAQWYDGTGTDDA